MQKASGYIKTTTTTNQERTTQMSMTLQTTPNYEIDKNDPVYRHKTNQALAKAVRDSVAQETIEVHGQRYIKNPGWLIMAGAAGYVVSGGEVKREGEGFIAKAFLRRSDNGVIVAEAEGFCSKDEKRWKHADEYAVRSMAQTRAASKVCKMALAACVPLMGIANLSATPADEVPPGGFQDINTDKYEEAPKPVNSISKADLADITAKLNGVTVKNNGGEPRDMELKFGKHKGSTLRQVAAFGDKGLDYLEWLSKQDLKPGADGKPYKNDIIRNEIIQEILLEAEALAKGNPNDEIPF